MAAQKVGNKRIGKQRVPKIRIDDEDRHGGIQKELENPLGTVKAYLKDVEFKWTRDYIPERKLSELKRSMGLSLKRNDSLHRMHGIITKDAFLRTIPEESGNDSSHAHRIFRTSEGDNKVLLLDGFLRFQILRELMENDPDEVWWTIDVYEGSSF